MIAKARTDPISACRILAMVAVSVFQIAMSVASIAAAHHDHNARVLMVIRDNVRESAPVTGAIPAGWLTVYQR